MIRRPVQRLCRRLRTEPSAQHQPGFIAWRILELDRNYKQWNEMTEEGERLRSKQPIDEWMREVNASFRRIVEPDIYPDMYLGLVLSDEELNAIAQALLERFSWDPEGAVSALGLTLKLEMVPALLAVIRSSARAAGSPNAQHAQGAAQAIETIPGAAEAREKVGHGVRRRRNVSGTCRARSLQDILKTWTLMLLPPRG